MHAIPTRRSFVAGAAALAALPRLGAARVAPEALARAAERARGLEQLHSLVVAVGGETVLEERARGPALGTPVNVKSVSKTLVATLTGAAIDRGVLPGPAAKALPYLRDRAPRGIDPRAGEVTVGHLLSMRSGLARTSGPGYGAWVSSDDWVGYILRQPMAGEPGGRMRYSTGDYHLLGAVLAEAAGRSLLALARDWLGTPLGVEIPPWTRDPQGLYLGGNNMALSPRAMLAFAEAIRTGGDPVVSRQWVETSWRARGRSPFSGHDYGYGWFLARLGGAEVRYARGYGGQMIYVLPELAMSVAITSDPTRPARSEGHAGALHALVGDVLVPAARSA
jgi:CubicO group peptidase (beta-lactamase class C family)